MKELKSNNTYGSLISDLSKYDIFYNTDKYQYVASSLYDRSVVLSNEELLSLEFSYPKYKKEILLLNKNNLDSARKVHIDNDCFVILDSKVECYYSKEMLDSYSDLKYHNTDTIKVVNTVSSSIKEKTFSLSKKDVITINKLSEMKALLDSIYHETCIDILSTKKDELVSFHKYLNEVGKFFYKDKTTIHDLNEIKINNTTIIKPNKNEIIPFFIKHF